MRTRIGVLIVLVIAFGILAGPKGAFAWSKDSGTGPSFLDSQVNPKAQGTRVDGTLTLYYEPAIEQGTWNRKVFTPYCSADDIATRMTWLIRFNHNFINYGFSGNAEPFCFVNNLNAQAVAIRDFISRVVIPSLFGSTGLLWEFKEIKNIAQPQAPLNGKACCRDGLGGGFSGSMEFFIADVAIAVQTR